MNRRAETAAELYTIAHSARSKRGELKNFEWLSQEAEQIEGENWIMFKAFLIGILIGVLLVAAGAWFYFTTGWAPVAVADPPMLLEKKLAHGALNARIGKDPHTDPAPVPLNEATYLAGGDVYKQNCAVATDCRGKARAISQRACFLSPRSFSTARG